MSEQGPGARTTDAARTPILFIHGLWRHASSWRYDAIAPGWPGDADTVEETRANRAAVADYGVDAVAVHVQIISKLPSPPIVIAHSFGGLPAEKLLGGGHGAAAVGIDAAPIKGHAAAADLCSARQVPSPAEPGHTRPTRCVGSHATP